MVRIIDVVTGVRPSELRFETRELAQEWLDNYRVDSTYKAEHYRIVPEENYGTVADYAAKCYRHYFLDASDL